MAQEVFKALLNAAVFPMAARLAHQTVMIPALDQNVKTPQQFYGEISSADFGVPQLIYAENVMPAGEGLIAAGYEEILRRPRQDSVDVFDQFIQLRDEDENLAFFCPAGGKNYILRSYEEGWQSRNPISAVGRSVSRAYVNGRTLVCYSGLGIYEYDTAANTFLPQTINGLTAAEIVGITQSNNYLIAHTRIGVHWSSLIDPLDFEPNLQTGAGNSIPQDVKGPITAVIGVPAGFLIFTPRNCIAATYSTNVRQPFIFREVDNCGGIESYEQIAVESSSAKAYAWTTGGLQTVSLRAAESIYPDVSDFLAGRLWEEWDTITKRFIRARQVNDFHVKVTHTSSRYLVISYGRRNEMFSYALVLDTVMRRWGKLKLPHTDAMFFTSLPSGDSRTYADAGIANEDYTDYANIAYADTFASDTIESSLKDSLAFMQANGRIVKVVMDYRERDTSAVAIFGRYQLRRSEFMTLQTVRVDHVDPAWDLEVTALATVDGSSEWRNTAGVQIENNAHTRKFGFDNASGKNISIAIEGNFELKDVEVAVSRSGR